MTTPLLTTKLNIPPVRPDLVPRTHLIERLNQGPRMGHRLTLISAPAGFGKTTLLAEWVNSSLLPTPRFAWLSLDDGDNDPARFLSYFVAALQTIEAGVGEGALTAIQVPQPPPIEQLLTALINEIAPIADPFVLILDDYHLIKAQPIHDALAFLLDHLPPRAHLGIATRADPPLPIARLRGRGHLTELRMADLRFTPDEAARFLDQALDLRLPADDIAALASRTEGWIAGLQMASLALQATVSMQGWEHVPNFIQAFTGSDRYVLDYLVEEVFRHQPASVQTFLLRTAILDRLSGPLCDAVVGEIENWRSEISPHVSSPISGLQSQAILEYLEAFNLFIVPLDNARQWYRYHRLFADLLRQRLNQVQPDLVATLHRRASEWHEQNELIAEAIDYALSAQDLERAADLIEQAVEATLMRSEGITLLNWLEALPDELVRARPSLCLFHVWALLMGSRPLDAIESRLKDLEEYTDLIPGRVASLRAWITIYQGHIPDAAEPARQALKQLPEDDLFSRSVAAWTLSLSCLADGDLETGSQTLAELARVSQDIGNVMMTVMALRHLARLRLRAGQLHEAKEIYEQALELATDKWGHPLPIAGEALIGLGELSIEWNDLEAATQHLVQGIELNSQWWETAAVDGYIFLARARQAQGDTDGAREAIGKAQQLAVKSEATELDDLIVNLQQAQLWVAQGNLEAATRWAEGRGLGSSLRQDEAKDWHGKSSATEPGAKLGDDETFINRHLRKYEHLVLARLLIAQNQPHEALALLEPLRPRMERRGRVGLMIEVHALMALAFQAQDDVGQALEALEQALSLAEPGGYVRTFVDLGPPMARLLYEAAARGIAPDYTGKLLAAFEAETKDERRKTKETPLLPAHRPPPVIEPLSERELEVLQLIAEGLSNREIAQRLFLSLPTIKWHASNIYGKLGVKNRTQAVAKARMLGILPTT